LYIWWLINDNNAIANWLTGYLLLWQTWFKWRQLFIGFCSLPAIFQALHFQIVASNYNTDAEHITVPNQTMPIPRCDSSPTILKNLAEKGRKLKRNWFPQTNVWEVSMMSHSHNFFRIQIFFLVKFCLWYSVLILKGHWFLLKLFAKVTNQWSDIILMALNVFLCN
jgi:hypothetical protein